MVEFNKTSVHPYPTAKAQVEILYILHDFDRLKGHWKKPLT